MQDVARNIFYRHVRNLLGSNSRFLLTLTEHLPRIENEVLNIELKDKRDLVTICSHYNSLLHILYELASIFEHEYRLKHECLKQILDSEVDKELFGLLKYFGFKSDFDVNYFIKHKVRLDADNVYLASGSIMWKIATRDDILNAFINIKDKFRRLDKLALEYRHNRQILDIQSDIDIMQMMHQEYIKYMQVDNWELVDKYLNSMRKISVEMHTADIKNLIDNTYKLMITAKDIENQYRNTSLLENILNSVDIQTITELKELTDKSICYTSVKDRVIKSRFGVTDTFLKYADLYIERGDYVEAIFIDDILKLHDYIRKVFDRLEQMI